MRATARLTLFILLGIGLAGPDLTAAAGAATRYVPHHGGPAHHRLARGRPKFRPARGAAAQDAARLGALVGKECHGKADMARNDHEWVVLCSNGRTFVVAPHQAGAPPTECSLAGLAPLPACYNE